MADDQEEMARDKAHSTFAQAVQVAKRRAPLYAPSIYSCLYVWISMNARNVLLTHFSARYPKMPPRILQLSDYDGPTLGLAFDSTRIKITHMRKLNLYLPAIE